MDTSTLNSTLRDAITRATAHFQAKVKNLYYRSSPELWAQERIQTTLWSKQREICESIVNNKYTAVKSGHAVGKTFLASILAQWWVDTHQGEDAIVVTTAPNFDQVKGILWEYIRKSPGWENEKLERGENLPGVVSEQAEWKASNRDIIGIGRKPAEGNMTSFQGRHYKYTLVIIDEACHDDQTDVLTREGWKPWADVTMNDELMTMDPDTHQACYQKPERLVAYEYNGPLRVYEGKGMNYAVTPNHEMLFQQRASGTKPATWHKQQRQEMTTWNNRSIKKVIEWGVEDNFDLSDAWLSLLGWFGAEGSVNKAVNAVVISQTSDRDDYKVIFNLAETCGFKPSKIKNGILISNTKLARYLEQFGRTQETRRVPSFVREASARQIGIYLDAYAAGDGYKRPGAEIIYTSCEDMADDLQELILKTGVPSVIRKRAIKDVSRWYELEQRYITSTRDGFVVTRPYKTSQAKMYNDKEIEQQYNGKVYCATVPNHLLFTRRKGYTMWSGNCGVSKELFDAVDAIVATGTCRVLAIGNPTDPNTHFGTIFLGNGGRGLDAWKKFTISVFDNPNFTGEEVPETITDNVADEGWVQKKREEYGEDSNDWKARVLGEFPESSEDSLFPIHLLYKATENVLDVPTGGRRQLGVDLAMFGSDSSAAVLNVGGVLTIVKTWKDASARQSANFIHNLCIEHEVTDVCIDSGTFGAAIIELVQELAVDQKYTVWAMAGNAKSSDLRKWINARAEWHGHMKEELLGSRIQLPSPVLNTTNQQLFNEMQSIKYRINPMRNAMQIESKKEMKARGVKSPDISDAAMYATAPLNKTDPLAGYSPGDTFTVDPSELFDEWDVQGYVISPC